MKYCKRCVIPDTRPGIEIGAEGVCSACLAHAGKLTDIDWERRSRSLAGIIEQAKSRGRGYDCIVPVSGGKDSTWQVVRCLEFGLRVLAVTWRTPARTEIGQRNLDNLISLGVDHIDYAINPEVERRFTYKALERVGDTAIPMHMALFSIPLNVAVAYDIPLVVWGESPHMEYGGSEDDRNYNRLDFGWLKRHGILQGTSVEDWIGDGLSRRDLEAYHMPGEAEFDARRIESIFLGFYLPWDPEESLRVAREHGFQVRAEGPKVGYYNYADIDCDFVSVHHYFKWLKFGFTRLFDNLSLEIRNGRMSRETALDVIRNLREQTPHEDIAKLCDFLRISGEHFWEIAERFRNPAVWSRKDGVWMIPGFIIEDWDWR